MGWRAGEATPVIRITWHLTNRCGGGRCSIARALLAMLLAGLSCKARFGPETGTVA